MRLVATVVLAILALSSLAGCSDDEGSGKDKATADNSPSAAKTFDVTGTLTMTHEDVVVEGRPECIRTSEDFLPECPAPAGTTCGPAVGSEYESITGGAQVSVYDENGKSVGIGELGQGATATDTVVDYYSDTPTSCAFPIRVVGIPDEGTIFEIDVDGQGKTKFSREDSNSVTITIGAPAAAPGNDGGGDYTPTKQDAFKAVQESVPYYKNRTFGEFDLDAGVHCALMDGLSGDVGAVEDSVANPPIGEAVPRKDAGIILRAAVAAWCPVWLDDVTTFYGGQ